MPKTTSLIKFLVLSVAAGALCACGNTSPSAPVSVSAAGKHPDGWLQQHYVAYKAQNGGSKVAVGTTGCSECHGSDLAGGISKVSCFTGGFNGMTCHPNGDGTLGHPAGWAQVSSTFFHSKGVLNGHTLQGSSATAIDAACGICHATGTAGTAAASAAPSCLSTGLAIACHTGSPATNSNGCVTCHGNGSGTGMPTGSAAPNRAGAHAAHIDAGIGCPACHSTDKHASAVGGQAFIKLDTAKYGSKNISFSYDSQQKCSGVSCHGGKTTPVGWYDNTAVGCRSCHNEKGLWDERNSYTANYPSNVPVSNPAYPNMSYHQYHLAIVNPRPSANGRLIDCIDCHNVDLLKPLHFVGLGTDKWMMDASATIGGGTTEVVTSDGDNGYVPITKNCVNQCHTLFLGPVPWK